MNDCDAIRIGLSARLDGEDPGTSVDTLDHHLSGCAECRGWLAGAERVTRQARAHPVAVPDLTLSILAAVNADRRQRVDDAARNRRQILRIAVGVAAFVQLALAVPVLFNGGVGPHATREMASFDIALAVGFALAAWRPERARAFVPVAFVLAACLTLTSGFDIASAEVQLRHEAGHIAALVQAGLLWALGRGTVLRSPRTVAA
ncbi:putative anti-sigma-YlaC factor YlaD [Allocatelliglobosispora scoriae]|uniref:Putative anti-sigma-YlaC factor YlaD n=1 Tax=Allocatelliglobosispora scoriae TaxID=643052 RepID=A0A841BPC5_9ACTN|nr:zf-HC2 domain-containing protein [Allocatelliglobosispora scoriae]MBB5870124.1 putative anti-sigma-YlaC factor YlaD [Allocatelliglobosispora scoriae]